MEALHYYTVYSLFVGWKGSSTEIIWMRIVLLNKNDKSIPVEDIFIADTFAHRIQIM